MRRESALAEFGSRFGRPRWLLVAVLLGTEGCAAWTPASVAPSTLGSKPREVRITLADGRRFPVSYPHIESDTLRGNLVGTPEEPVSLALSDITAIDLPRTDTNMAVNLAAFGGMIAFWFGLIAYVGTRGGPGS